MKRFFVALLLNYNIVSWRMDFLSGLADTRMNVIRGTPQEELGFWHSTNYSIFHIFR